MRQRLRARARGDFAKLDPLASGDAIRAILVPNHACRASCQERFVAPLAAPAPAEPRTSRPAAQPIRASTSATARLRLTASTCSSSGSVPQVAPCLSPALQRPTPARMTRPVSGCCRSPAGTRATARDRARGRAGLAQSGEAGEDPPCAAATERVVPEDVASGEMTLPLGCQRYGRDRAADREPNMMYG